MGATGKNMAIKSFASSIESTQIIRAFPILPYSRDLKNPKIPFSARQTVFLNRFLCIRNAENVCILLQSNMSFA